MPMILKLKCQGEVRRVQLQEDENLTYEIICEKIKILFPELGPHSIKYPDDEGDLCTLCPSTFPDFFSLADGASGQQVLKLEIVPSATPQAPAAVAANNSASQASAGQALPQQSAAQQAPPPVADDIQKAMALAGETMQKPEIQQALQSLQGTPLAGLAGLAQAFAGPAATGAGLAGLAQASAEPAAADKAAADSATCSGADEACMKGLQSLFQSFAAAGGLGGGQPDFGGQPPWSAGGAHGTESENWLLEPRMWCTILSQWRAAGVLSGKVVAGAAAHMMSKLVSKVVENVEIFDCEVKLRLNDLRPVLEDLQALVSCTPGLEHCAGVIGAVLCDESASAGEALLLLLTAIDVLPFEAQVDFLEAFYNSQEHRLHKLLDETDEKTPGKFKATCEHAGVVCDGCGAHPLKGLRFKSKIADVDLCGECFAQKMAVHGGQYANHEFQCIVCDLQHEIFQGISKYAGKGFGGKGKCKDWWPEDFKGKGKGKGKDWWAEHFEGKGKGKGKDWWAEHFDGKGKGKGKDWWAEHFEDKGKGKGKDWWSEHFEGKGKGKGKWAFKGKGKTRWGHSDSVPSTQSSEARSDAPEPKRPRLSFPVVIEDGRKLTIEWEQGENPQEVAKRFADNNGILPDEFQTIVDFIVNASVMAEAQSAQAEQESCQRNQENPVSKSEDGAMDVEQEVGQNGAETIEMPVDVEPEVLGDGAETSEMPVEIIPDDKDADQSKSLDDNAKQLAEMGFGCAEEMRVLLEACGGNVQMAIESLTK